MNRRIAHAAQIGALALALALVPAALAARGGGSHGGGNTTSSGSGLSLHMVTDTGTPGVSYGDTVTFDVSTTAPYPAVELDCYQNGALVLKGSAGFFPSYMWSKDFPLTSDRWTGGAADCLATLYYTAKNGTNTPLKTLSFTAAA